MDRQAALVACALLATPARAGAPPADPAPAPPGSPGSSTGAPSEAAAVVSTDTDNSVTVRGEKGPAGARSLERAEVRLMPGAFGDPLRAIEALPGVTPLVSGAPFYYVRGAPPGNVGYFLDGVRVPYLFHVFLGPSVLHPGLIQRVDLFPSAYPASYGRFAGGIVAAETAPPQPEFHGEASLRLIDAGGLVEAPFADGKGVVLVGGRYSYTALLFSLLSPSTSLSYWDYQARASYRTSPRGEVSVLAFGAGDFLGEKRDQGTKTFFDSQFHRVDLRYDEALAGGGAARVALTTGLDLTRTDGGQRLRDRMVALRSTVTRPIAPDLALRGGLDVTTDIHDQLTDEGDATVVLVKRDRIDLAMSGYLEAPWAVSSRVVVTPGVRLDLYGSTSPGGAARGESILVAADPRLMARYRLTEGVRATHSFGVAHQPPSFVVPLPGFQPDPFKGGLQTAVQSSAGVEADLPGAIVGSVTGFHSAFYGLSDALGSTRTDASGPADDEARSRGSAVGVEVNLRRSLTRRLGGFLSYTLSRSVRTVGDAEFPANFDRTHVFSGALSHDLGGGYRAGGRLVFYTGTPRYPDQPGTSRPAHPSRLPSFYRLDLRFERRWRVGEAGSLSLVAEMLNATIRQEALGVRCDSAGCADEVIGPIAVPSLGVEATY
jgi:hypothetical protein